MILNSYKFLVARLLVDSGERVRQQLNSGKDGFTARNDSQAYFCRSLSLAFIEVSIQCFSVLVNAWVKVFRINPEFSILRLAFYDGMSASKY